MAKSSTTSASAPAVTAATPGPAAAPNVAAANPDAHTATAAEPAAAAATVTTGAGAASLRLSTAAERAAVAASLKGGPGNLPIMSSDPADDFDVTRTDGSSVFDHVRDLRDPSGEHTADTRRASDQALANALTAAQSRLSVPAAGPIPAPLPPVQPYGTRGDARPFDGRIAPELDRRYAMDVLASHPNPEVRQRAQEAQAAAHHGAADTGIKMRAAIDTAKQAERTR